MSKARGLRGRFGQENRKRWERPSQKLEKLLRKAETWDILVVEHKDQLIRLGLHYTETLLSALGNADKVVNLADNDKEGLGRISLPSFIRFSARMYGLRRSKRRTERLLACLEQEAKDATVQVVQP